LLFSGSRLPFAFSNEGQFPKIFSYVDKKYKTPTISLVSVAVITIIISTAWSFLAALTVAVIIRVSVYLFVCASLIKLRKKIPQQTDFYKLRFGNALAITGIALCIWLLSAARLIELRNAAIFVSLGIIIYFLQRKFNKTVTSAKKA
jgi:amino acid transporter